METARYRVLIVDDDDMPRGHKCETGSALLKNILRKMS